jgi:hypothetical protein
VARRSVPTVGVPIGAPRLSVVWSSTEPTTRDRQQGRPPRHADVSAVPADTLVLRARRIRCWGGGMAAAAAALAVLGSAGHGPARWLAEATAAVLAGLAWTTWRSAVECGPNGIVVRQGFHSRFLPWTAIAHVEARPLRGWPGLQVVLARHDGTLEHLRALSGGLFLDRIDAPLALAGWLALHLARASAGPWPQAITECH